MSASARLGRLGEDLAARDLEAAGLVLVVRNWRCSRAGVRGEIDIVAWDGPTLVFCEVKARRGARAGGPFAAVTPRKRSQLRRLAAVFMADTGLRADEIRFDVVGVDWSPDSSAARVTHLRGAL
ncbi:MAG TPA: YraN family protein [Egibacteraceae bacterium]|nr:YraN family protein [Egibacteraceae bacterium]